MHFILPQTVSPYIVLPSNIVTYLKTEHCFIISCRTQSSDSSIHLTDAIPRQIFGFHRDENLDCCCLDYNTVYWLAELLRNLVRPSSLISWRMRQQVSRKLAQSPTKLNIFLTFHLCFLQLVSRANGCFPEGYSAETVHSLEFFLSHPCYMFNPFRPYKSHHFNSSRWPV